jgi:hypothetical protein
MYFLKKTDDELLVLIFMLAFSLAVTAYAITMLVLGEGPKL